MKNINSNWLGTPPEHWKALKLRQILRPFSEKNHADLQLLSVVREKGVIVRDTENDDNHNYMIDSGNEDITPEWIEWALKKADWYDPSIETEDEYLGKRQHEKSAEEKEKSLQDSIRKSWYW